MKRMLATLLLGTVFTACQHGTGSHRVAEAPKGCCKPGDQLNIVMEDYPRWTQDCLDWGGEPIQYPNGVRVCEDVDF